MGPRHRARQPPVRRRRDTATRFARRGPPGRCPPSWSWRYCYRRDGTWCLLYVPSLGMFRWLAVEANSVVRKVEERVVIGVGGHGPLGCGLRAGAVERRRHDTRSLTISNCGVSVRIVALCQLGSFPRVMGPNHFDSSTAFVCWMSAPLLALGS